MAGDTVLTIIGNLTGDPELRFTPSGAAVTNFTVASTPRMFDRQSNEWKDGETLFMRCAIWRDAAENVAESLQRGARVIVTGRLKSRSYETKEGEKRTVVELDVDEVGPSLRYATAKVNKTQRGGGSGGFGGSGGSGGFGGGQQEDPWATGGSAPQGGSGGQQGGSGGQQGGSGGQQGGQQGGGGYGSPAGAGQGGQGGQSAPGGGQGGQGGQAGQGGWGNAPAYDEPPF
ncbi:MAG TPA: single-stranded DNA-binding protein [Dermatophilaceae bacterium]|nr:single-stranded DNA-binding protein [Dermatophilaceae bacterium]